MKNKEKYQFLKLVFKKYVNKHGYGKRNLSEFYIFTTSADCFEDEMPSIFEEENCVRRSRLLSFTQELEIDGFLEIAKDGQKIFLTEAGYDFASQGFCSRVLSYLNKNPGLSIPISVVSVIVSIFAMILSLGGVA